jgi:hypothetical protein
VVLPLASGVRVSTRPRSRSRRGAVWRWARCMRRGTAGAVRLTVQALQLTALSLLLGSLRSLLLLSSLLLLGSLRSLLLLGSLRSLLLLSSLSLLLLGSLGLLLLGSLGSLLLLGSLGSLLLLGSLRSLLLLGSLSSLLLSSLSSLLLSSLSSLLVLLLVSLLRRKPLLRSVQPLIWARLRGRSPGRLIRLSPRRRLDARPLPLHILR